MFGALEENADRLGIVDYSVSQTSLEQVNAYYSVSMGSSGSVHIPFMYWYMYSMATPAVRSYVNPSRSVFYI